MAGKRTIADTCDCSAIHDEIIAKVRKKLPNEELLLDLAELFKVFGDSTRIKIINALLYSEMCVCDLAVLFGMSKSAVSHQLRILRQTKLVKFRRNGKVVFYSLDDKHVSGIFNQGFAHINEEKK